MQDDNKRARWEENAGGETSAPANRSPAHTARTRTRCEERHDDGKTLTDTERTAADDEHAGGALDAVLEALEPGDAALLRPARNVEHVRVLVRDGPPEVDGRGEVAAEGVDEEVEAERAV